MTTIIKVEGQVPDSPDPDYVTDTYDIDTMEFLTPVHNYGSNIVMVKLGQPILIDIEELQKAVNALKALM